MNPPDSEEKPAERRFQIVPVDWRPDRCLPLDPKEQSAWWIGWRKEALTKLSARDGRALKLAWLISCLAPGNGGYCEAGNSWLAENAGLALAHIDGALKQLEDLGLVWRGHVDVGRKQPQRRIWAAMPATVTVAGSTTVTVAGGCYREGGKTYYRDGSTEKREIHARGGKGHRGRFARPENLPADKEGLANLRDEVLGIVRA